MTSAFIESSVKAYTESQLKARNNAAPTLLACCGTCNKFSFFPCLFNYFTDGDPFVGNLDQSGRALNPNVYLLNCDVAKPFGSNLDFPNVGSNQATLLMASGQFAPRTCLWTGAGVGSFYYDSSQDKMILQSQIVGSEFPFNSTQFLQNLTYGIPFASFDPCGNNVLPLLGSTIEINTAPWLGPTAIADHVIITRLAHGHKGFLTGEVSGIIIDEWPLPDWPCACPNAGCANLPASLSVSIPALAAAGFLPDPIKVYRVALGSSSSVGNCYVGATSNTTDAQNQIVNVWVAQFQANSGVGSGAYSLVLRHDKFPFFQNGNTHPVLCELTASTPFSSNCPPAPQWVFNNFVSTGPNGDCNPLGDGTGVTATVTL